MVSLSALTLILNAAVLALCLALLLILLWFDMRSRQVQLLAAFLSFIVLWNTGSLLIQGIYLVQDGDQLTGVAVLLLELGFTGAGVAAYALTTILVGVHTRYFRLLAFLSLLIVVVFRVLNATKQSAVELGGISEAYRFSSLALAFFGLYNLVTLYMLWRYRRRMSNRMVIVGLLVFQAGQGFVFLNPTLPLVNLATNVSAMGALLVTLALVRQQIMTPLLERGAQISTMYRVTQGIARQLSTKWVLNEIVQQAVTWFKADAVVVLLYVESRQVLEVAMSHELPISVLPTEFHLEQGLVGTVAAEKSARLLENYSRDWKGAPDFPQAMDTVGAVMCVPMLHNANLIGVLLVIAGKQGYAFSQDQLLLLELLAGQAALTIAHSRLFNQIEAARDQLETLLTSLDSPVIAVDRAGSLVFANPAALRITSIHEAIHNGRIQDLLLPDHRYEDYTKRVVPTEPTQAQLYEMQLMGRDYLCHIAAVDERSTGGWVVVMNDVTHLKELDRLKSEMLRMVSHDLKNPMMGAMLSVELLQDMVGPPLDVPVRVVAGELERMKRIILGVLDLERIRGGRIDSNWFRLDELLARILRDVQPMAQNAGISLHLEAGELNIKGDASQLERALFNLVENAVKFTLNEGKVWVRARWEGKSLMRIEVSDTGVGIPADQQPQVFERFFRANQEGTQHITGSGLGLSIVQTVVDNHGGHIWLESTIGQGTTFYVLLPVKSRSSDEALSETATDQLEGK